MALTEKRRGEGAEESGGWRRMAGTATRRMQKELREVTSSNEARAMGLKLTANEGNLQSVVGEVRGPPDTPFADGIYKIAITIPDTFPFDPPQAKFATKIWHPNVSSATGLICLDILKNGEGGRWTPSMSLRSVLVSIIALLNSPEPNDPQDAVVASQMLNRNDIYKATARTWAQEYANAPGNIETLHRNAIESLVSINIDRSRALTNLSICDWDVDKARVY